MIHPGIGSLLFSWHAYVPEVTQTKFGLTFFASYLNLSDTKGSKLRVFKGGGGRRCDGAVRGEQVEGVVPALQPVEDSFVEIFVLEVLVQKDSVTKKI